jgi:polyhydroxyalkanoate synthesis regulator phasin
VAKKNIGSVNIITKLKKSDGESAHSTLTVEHLTKAIKNSIDKAGMPEEEARAMAQHVMNFFGYSERIIDNVLEPEDRDAFYMLEDAGILMTEREETTLYDGREWRIHYWMFRKERISELISGRRSADVGEGESVNVYDDVPEDIWSRE